jgi:ankyrin repeat protein
MAVKRKCELYDLCVAVDEDNEEESWNNIRQWLSCNKGHKKWFKAAACYQGKAKSTPLHTIVMTSPPPLDVVETLIKHAPETAQIRERGGGLPLHWACWYSVGGASLEIVRALVKAYPESVKMQDKRGWLPIHTFMCTCCYFDNSLETVRALVKAYPESVTMQDKRGWLPIHHLCDSVASLEVLNFIVEAYPESIDIETIDNRRPSDILRAWIEKSGDAFNNDEAHDYCFALHRASAGGFSVNLVKLLFQAFPESCMIKDANGMIPLHHACSNNTADLLDIVIVLLEASPPESSTVTDKQGRTPSQILKPVASHKDERGMLLLHHLAAHSKSFSANFLNLLISAYPQSIAVPDNHGMLPFHHACLNTALSLDVLMLFVKSNPACMISATKLSIALNTMTHTAKEITHVMHI